MPSERIRFDNGRGQELAAIVDEPEEPARAWAIFAHCFTCSKNLKVVGSVSGRLRDRGFGVLRFDFTGLGQSEGEFAETTFTSNVHDLEAAAGWLAREREAPRLLVGHSLGGAAVLAAAGTLESVACIATIGAPAEVGHVKHLLRGPEFPEGAGRAEVSIGGRPFQIGRDFVEDLERHDLPAEIGRLRKPLLIFHSPVDTIVGIDNAEKIYHAAKHPKSFVSLGDADHLLTDDRASGFTGDVLAAWAAFYA